MSWKLVALAPRGVIEAALLAHEDALEWDPEIVISGSEVAEDKPDDWQLEAWLSRKPSKADKAAIAALFDGGPPRLREEKLPDVDWVTASQQGLEPIRAGRFHVHTPEHLPLGLPEVRDFVIPASQAFGTGTGLLAFAALHLWPHALATASDIDAVCVGVVEDNARANNIAMGARPGELTMLVADGMEHPLLKARGPYDLIIANILAGPLIDLAPHFAKALIPGGHLVLAGLLETQEPQVRRAARAAGMRIAERKVNGDWSILWLRKRVSAISR